MATHFPLTSTTSRAWQRAGAIGLCTCWLLLASCNGDIVMPLGPSDQPGAPASALDPGRKGPHRLSNHEYNNTVRDLLGTALTPANTFLVQEQLGFDNNEDALGVTSAQFEAYFAAAEALASEAFGDPALRERIVRCTPATPSEEEVCARADLAHFAARAFRSAVETPESERWLTLYESLRSQGEAYLSALQQVVAAMLASPRFLFRIELDREPNAAAVVPVEPYGLASRLSYFLWSTMPDERLFALAEDGSLLQSEVLADEVERMLADAKSDALVKRFAGQWLGIRSLESHRVLSEAYPSWDERLRDAMIHEAEAYFDEFLRTDLAWDRFLVEDLNFVNPLLATHYGMAPPAGEVFARVMNHADERRGFLGLAAFLTSSSFAHRTSPTLRATRVLSSLLCTEPPPPPANVMADLDADQAANDAADLENVRERLELHRSNPQCAGCHATMDPIGLGLERFDAIGRFRERYSNGDVVDARGTLPAGVAFDGLLELTDTLQRDARFAHCTAEKLFTYALGRGVDEATRPQLEALVDAWRAQGLTFRNLIRELVLSDVFRFRRGV